MQGVGAIDEPQVTVVGKADKADDKSTPPIVRPSSLNYKISLLEAVQAFMQKDKGTDQKIEVELEEPVSKKMHNYEILDDALYIINRSNVLASQVAIN
jgi:hypothetical protein